MTEGLKSIINEARYLQYCMQRLKIAHFPKHMGTFSKIDYPDAITTSTRNKDLPSQNPYFLTKNTIKSKNKTKRTPCLEIFILF